MSHTEEIIELPTGVSLSFAVQEEGLAVVLLHGWPDSWRSYEQVLAHLPAGMRVFAVSLRGFGESGRPEAGYSPADFATDVVAFLDAVGVEAAVLVGHSMGMLVAQRVAIDHPRRVLGLVLLGGFASLPAAVGDEVSAAVADLEDPIDEAFVREFQSSTLAQPVPEEFFRTFVAESTKAPARVWRTAFDGVTGADHTAELRSLSVPTLLIWSDQDALIPRAEQNRLAASIAGSRVIVYEGGGHSPNWEEPARLADDIATFARRVTEGLER